MTMRVLKYEVLLLDEFSIMTACGRILCVQVLPKQPGVREQETPYIWVSVESEYRGVVRRRFRLAGAGHAIDNERISYIGTFQLHAGELVFHLFEVVL